MLPKIEKARKIRASMALEAQNLAPAVPEDSVWIYVWSILLSHPPPLPSLTVCNLKQTLVVPKVNDDYGDTVPSRPQNVGLQVANEVPTSSTLSKPQMLDGIERAGEGICLADILYVTFD